MPHHIIVNLAPGFISISRKLQLKPKVDKIPNIRFTRKEKEEEIIKSLSFSLGALAGFVKCSIMCTLNGCPCGHGELLFYGNCTGQDEATHTM